MKIWSMVAAATASIIASSFADTLTVGSSKDNTLYESATGAFSNGAGQNMFAGVTNGGFKRRAVVAFDISSIPEGSTITKVELTLFMSKTRDTANTVSLHRTTKDWGQGTSDGGFSGGDGAASTANDATWVHTFFNTSNWSTQGGDFVQAPSSQLSIGAVGTYTWPSTAALVADVQEWLDTPSNSFGWTIVGAENIGVQTTKRFETRENAVVSHRPSLKIEYTLPPDCPADFNGDGFLTGDDFDEFVAEFELGNDSADFNGDDFVTGDDFDEYVAAFEAGCE